MLFKIIDSKGASKSDTTLDFSEETASDHHLYLTINKQSKHLRLVNASTKSRGMVSGGGAKPYRQKGTGNARQGTRRSPLRVGGGVIFGPSPRVRRVKCSKTIIKKSILESISCVDNRYVLDESSSKDLVKTKDFSNLLSSLSVNDKNVLVISSFDDINLTLSSRNLNNVRLSSPQNLIVSDILSSDAIIFTSNSFERFKELV